MAGENWTIGEVLDQVRSWHTRNVKPFEKLPEALAAAARILDEEVPRARQDLDALTTQIADLRAEGPRLEGELEAARARTAEAVKEARQTEETARTATATIEAAARQRREALLAEYAAKTADLEDAYTARASAIQTEIAALEAQRDALHAEVAVLRHKFATF